MVCPQIWITSPIRNVTALELDGRDGEVAVIVIVSHDADTLLHAAGSAGGIGVGLTGVGLTAVGLACLGDAPRSAAHSPLTFC